MINRLTAAESYSETCQAHLTCGLLGQIFTRLLCGIWFFPESSGTTFAWKRLMVSQKHVNWALCFSGHCTVLTHTLRGCQALSICSTAIVVHFDMKLNLAGGLCHQICLDLDSDQSTQEKKTR